MFESRRCFNFVGILLMMFLDMIDPKGLFARILDLIRLYIGIISHSWENHGMHMHGGHLHCSHEYP